MYQPDFPSVPFRLGLYPVVDSVVWIERLLKASKISATATLRTM